MSQDASQSLKERGNAHFKGGRFADAVDFYTRAEQSSPEDAVYPSNLSAALFELGDYASCLRAICRATDRCIRPDDPLLSRLSLRLAKALAYLIRRGRIPSTLLDDASKTIERLSALGEASTASEELRRAWQQWRRVESEIKRVSENSLAAQSRLACLPAYKMSADPMFEYYSIGHDNIMSIVDDWGLGDDEKNPMNLEQLPLSRLSKLGFMFGGAGDARHIFGSIIGLKKAYATLDEQRRSSFNAHITLVDIHPTALARDLCLLLLLDDLLNDQHSEMDKVEIHATLFYAYVGVIMPSYCYQRFQNTVKALLKNLQSDRPILPSYIHVSPSSIPGIVGSLTYWVQGLSGKTVHGMLKHHSSEKAAQRATDMLTDPRLASSFTDSLAEREEAKRLEQIAFIRDLPDEKVIEVMGTNNPTPCPGLEDPIGRKRWLAESRDEMLAFIKERSDQVGPGPANNTPEVSREEGWYMQVRAYVPPAVLCERSHTGIGDGFAILRGPFDETKKGELKRATKEAKEDIKTTWKANPSLFDPFYDRQSGYPDMHMDAFQAIRCVEDFNDRFGILDVNASCPSFSILENFFSAVVDALQEMKGSITLEVIQGDIFHELRKIRLGEETSRPTEFPRQYARIWLSNVPDYTQGPLNTAIYAVPALECTEDASVSSNCLLNTGLWQDGDHFCHNYTLLTAKEMPRFLGCLVISMVPAYGQIALGRQEFPRPLRELATREELNTWLTRVFIYTLIPPTTGKQAYRVRYPNNLVTFVNLLVHLHSVGFPSHWLSDFLSVILSNGFVTEIAPFPGEFPIPLSERTRRVKSRKLNLDPWLVEFETILATSYEAIPFVIPVPINFPKSSDDIGVFEIRLQRHMFTPMTGMMLLPAFDPVMGLLFYNRGVKHSGEILAMKVGEILEGGMNIRRGDLHILTAVEMFDMSRGVIRWKMSKERVRKMKADGWSVMPYRFDARESAADATPASRWAEVSI